MPFDIGGPQFGLRDAKIAVHNGDGSYGTLVDVYSVQLYSAQIQTTTAELTGDDSITAVHATGRSAQVQLRFGSVQLGVLEILTGQTLSSSGSSPNIRREMIFDNFDFPYFGIAGKAVASEGAGAETHLVLPKVKITDGFQVNFEYGSFAIPEVTAMAVTDPDYTDLANAIAHIVQYESSTDVAIPPT
jgi:hypothetical protein